LRIDCKSIDQRERRYGLKARVCFHCQEYIFLDSDELTKAICFDEDHMEHPIATIEINDIKNVKNFACEDDFYTKIAKYRNISRKANFENLPCH
jgi:Uri superfamily endonuclease